MKSKLPLHIKSKLTPHEAKILEALARGETIQCAVDDGIWMDWLNPRSINFDAYTYWRIKPEMVRRAGEELPVPLFEAPPMETRLYVPCANNERGFEVQYWRNGERQQNLLRHGMLFLREDDASLHAGAMFNFTKL